MDVKGRGSDIELQDIEGQVTVNGTFVGQKQFRNLAKPFRYEGSMVELNAEKLPGQIRFEAPLPRPPALLRRRRPARASGAMRPRA